MPCIKYAVELFLVKITTHKTRSEPMGIIKAFNTEKKATDFIQKINKKYREGKYAV
jgi:hypothetical protein